MLRASNKTANYVLLVALIIGGYFGLAFIPVYADNFELKSQAREFMAAARRDEQETEKAKLRFIQAAGSMGIKLTENDFTYDKGDRESKVGVQYKRDVEFLGVQKKKTLTFKWVVTMKFR